MRLLLAVLAALGIGCGANAHAIHYPFHGQLLSYAPAPAGNSPQDGQVRGYVRYLTEDGSERLIGYKYPEPLNGVRRPESASLSQDKGFDTAAALQHAEKRLDLIRVWCKERYEALMLEVQRLRAEGKQPSADMLAQLKPLEAILENKVVGETPEVKRAREDHLRMWNEARLKVLQLEAEQLKLQGQQVVDITPITYDRNAADQQLKQTLVASAETEEQKKARAEHLRIYNEHLLRVQQLQGQQPVSMKEPNTPAQFYLKTADQQGLPDTPEVQRAREEHLRLWNEARLRVKQEDAPKQEAGSLDAIIANLKSTTYNTKPAFTAEISPSLLSTPAASAVVIRAPGIPHKDFPALPLIDSTDTQMVAAAADPAALNIIPGVQQPINAPYNAAQPLPAPTVAAPQAPAQIQDTPEVQRAREEHLKLVKEAQIKASQSPTADRQQAGADIAVDELQETERLRAAEVKLRTEESLLEKQRIEEEERLLEAERLRLQQEEQGRAERERLAELEQRQQQQQQQLKPAQEQRFELSAQTQFVAPATAQAQFTGAFSKDALPASGDYNKNPFLMRFAFVGQQQPATQLPNVGYYYLPDANPTAANVDNPFLVRHVQIAQQNEIQNRFDSAALSAAPSALLLKSQNVEQAPIASIAAPGAGLNELEKARLEHFRAHQVALEQLRVANAKSGSEKDCKQDAAL